MKNKTPIDSERDMLIQAVHTGAKVEMSKKTKEEAATDEFMKIVTKIEQADKVAYPQLHDPMMETFCAATRKEGGIGHKANLEIYKTGDMNPNYAQADIDEWNKNARFAFTQVSPNGEFLAGVTFGGEVVVFDLKFDPSTGSEKFFKIKVEGKREKQAPLKTEDSMAIPDEGGDVQGKVDKYKNIKDKGNEEEVIEEPKTDILIDFSTDSVFLAIARHQVIDLYNCREVFAKKGTELNKLDWDITEDEYKEVGKLKFMYFYRPSFENTLYQSPDREMLMLGYEKKLLSRTIQKDNLTKDKLHIGNDNDVFEREEQMTGLDSEFYRAVMKEAGEAPIWTNRGNHVFFRKRKNQVDTLSGYRIDWDNEDDEKRFTLFCEYKMKKQKVFPSTFTPNGKFVYVYNEKASLIQKLLLDTKADVEDVYHLTGKKKNFKHLAVKNDGKYLLIVDSQLKAEVLVRSGKSYAPLTGFEASYEPDASGQQVHQRAPKEKKTAEQDLSDMDFIEDGSGIVFKVDDALLVVRIRLPTPRLGQAVFLKAHFFNSRLRVLADGRYSFSYFAEDDVYQKIVDFDPETNGGCIVRTIDASEYAEPDDLLEDLEQIYCGEVQWEHMNEQGFGNFKDQLKQLENQLKDEENDLPTMNNIYPIPHSNLMLVCFSQSGQIAAFHQDFFKAADRRQPVYTITPEFDVTCSDEWRRHSPFFIDQFGQYITVTYEDDGPRAAVHDAKTGELHCKIEDGLYFYCISKTKMLVLSREEPPQPEEVAESPDVEGAESPDVEGPESPDVEQPEPKFIARVFDLEAKAFTATKFPINAMEVNLIKTVEIEGKQIALFIIDGHLVGFDVAEERKTFDIAVVEREEKIAVSDHFDAHCVLLSPNGRFLALSSLADCDTVKIFEIGLTVATPDQLTLKVRSDRMNRWCFDKDSKYFLLKTAEGISVYSVHNFEVPVCIIPLDDHVAKFAKVMSIRVASNNQDLELAFGYKNFIYFQRVPFMPTVDDLMLPYLNTKLADYLSDRSLKTTSIKGNAIAQIMAQQIDYQKRLDKTYIKILAMVNNKTLLDKYFENLTDESELILGTDDFPALVYMMVKNEKGQFEHKLNKNAANSYIDLIESKVEEEKKFPHVRRQILDDWLSSEQLDTEYMRKLLKLITFEPVNTTLKGELRKKRWLATSLTKIEHEHGVVDTLSKAKEQLVDIASTDQTNFDCYQTAIGFDLANGSEFSLNYFRWLTNVSDDDLQYLYKSVIFYKWNKVLPWAIVYSVVFWALNALYVAYMGFAYDNVGLLVTIITLNCLFILYEIKCFAFTFKDSYNDLWNYYDMAIHSFSIFSVFFVHYQKDNPEAYKYSWLRLFSFVLISLRAFTMLRVLSATRYLIVMLLAVFKDMVSFLSVFFYIIFIYLFVCLIRTNLTPDGQDTDFYTAVQEAFNIAFSNFSADVDSVIVLVSTVIGQVVLGLVLLNYLIAIVNATYARISDKKDLHDMRMLLDVIREFDCFFNVMQKFSEKGAERLFIIAQQREDSNTMADLRTAFVELKAEQQKAVARETELQRAGLELAADGLLKAAVAPALTQIASLAEQVSQLEEAVKIYKKKTEDERKSEREHYGVQLREAEEKKRREAEELKLKMQREVEEAERRLLEMEEQMSKVKIEAGEAGEKARKFKEELSIRMKEDQLRKESLLIKIEEQKEEESEEDDKRSFLSEMSLIEASEADDESANDFNNRSIEQDADREEGHDKSEEYEAEGECKVEF